MARKERIDPELPPTKPGDWIAAVKVLPGHDRPTVGPGAMIFHVFRSSVDSSVFAITDRSDVSVLPPCPNAGRWVFFKKFAESGQPRVGFSEATAKADILKQGYHLNRISVRVSETTS